jgi:hypothetical protein
MVVYNNFSDRPLMLKSEVQARDSLASNLLDFEKNEIDFETFAVEMDVMIADVVDVVVAVVVVVEIE